ncbi:hypothetical protein HY251_01555, partial [bacterium]|nr:hypothetical protein [bacterium]
ADSSRALELDPKLAHAWASRAAARLLGHELDGAIADASRALELDANDVLALHSRGLARSLAGDVDGARADFERYVELDTVSPEAAKARAWLEKNRPRRAGP